MELDQCYEGSLFIFLSIGNLIYIYMHSPIFNQYISEICVHNNSKYPAPI